MDLYNIRKIWNPDWFQGNRRQSSYFEGWYFKLVNPGRNVSYAVIPGISMGRGNADAYSFIQVIDGQEGESSFIKYGADQFSFSRREFGISIADNHFSATGIQLNLNDSESKISGNLSFHKPVPYPVKLMSPGVMGWYRFVPTMECYHGIVSMLHTLHGSLNIRGEEVDFTGGKGYAEKDWGKSMPLAWIWMQSNHFRMEDLSISFSIANIPWKRSAFTGFLIILSTRQRIYRFTTYTGARINKLSVSDGHVELEVRNRHYLLTAKAHAAVRGNLKAPVEGEMSRTIHESIGARVSILMRDRKGNILLEGTGDPAGLEVAGDVNILQR